jgi:phosphoribosyl 1,2-cyclic phosphate phosphodiesterase
MEILFMGTAAAEGIPALFCRCEICRRAAKAGGKDVRSRCGYLINKRLMLDLTPDILYHKFRYELDLAAVEAVCFTHSHSDHLNWADLAFRVTPWFAVIPGEKPLKIYANHCSCELIKKGLDFDPGQAENASLEIHEIAPRSVIECAALRLTAFRAVHNPPEDCLFYLVEEGDTAFLQMNDTAMPGDDLEERLAKALNGKKLSIVSMDCTQGKEDGGSGHMAIESNIMVKERLMSGGFADGQTRFFANHFSHNGHCLHDELSLALAPHGITPAYDGMILR